MKYSGKRSKQSANRWRVSLNSFLDTQMKRENGRGAELSVREKAGERNRESKLAVTINLLRLRSGNWKIVDSPKKVGTDTSAGEPSRWEGREGEGCVKREEGARGRKRETARGGWEADTTSDIRSEKTELIKPAAKGRNSRRRGAEIKNVNLRDWKPQSRHGRPSLVVPLPPHLSCRRHRRWPSCRFAIFIIIASIETSTLADAIWLRRDFFSCRLSYYPRLRLL